MKYILLREGENNIGMVALTGNYKKNIKTALESHFDAEVRFDEKFVWERAINGYPEDITVEVVDEDFEAEVEVSECWLY